MQGPLFATHNENSTHSHCVVSPSERRQTVQSLPPSDTWTRWIKVALQSVISCMFVWAFYWSRDKFSSPIKEDSFASFSLTDVQLQKMHDTDRRHVENIARDQPQSLSM